MKRRITALGLALLLALSLTTLPASAAGRPWEDAYAKYIKEIKAEDFDLNWTCEVMLIDLDRDGIPELLLGSPGARNRSFAEKGATYRNGALHALSISEWDMGLEMRDDIEMYQNNTTGERKIEAPSAMPYGMGVYGSLSALWLDGYTLHCVPVFEEDIDYSSGKEEATYFVNGQQVSGSKYDAAYNSRNNGWSKVSDFQIVCERLEDGIAEATNAEIMAIFSQWKGGESAQPAGKTASPTSHSMTVNGAEVNPAAYNIDGNNYFKLRDIAALLTGTDARFQVGYNAQTQAISLSTGQPYSSVGGELAALPTGAQKVVPTPSAVYVDGEQVSFTSYNINGNNYFKLRDLGQALGFSVDWNEGTRTIVVKTK